MVKKKGRAKKVKIAGWSFEKKLQKLGYLRVAGFDEVGRGPWAGPIVAAGCILNFNFSEPLADSKSLSPLKRERLALKIKEEAVAYYVAQVSSLELDQLGLASAAKLVFKRALAGLSLVVEPDYCLVDAFPIETSLPQEAIVKGDSKVTSIAAASILAKVARDKMMVQLAQKYPGYGLENHKGYGTKGHRLALQELGVSACHRRSFRPIRDLC